MEQLVTAAVAESALLVSGRVAEVPALPALSSPGGGDRAENDVRSGVGRPVDRPPLEELVAAAVAQSADLVGGRIGQVAGLPPVVVVGVVDLAADAVGSGGGGPVDGAVLEHLPDSALLQRHLLVRRI